jgi:hypothetical protein
VPWAVGVLFGAVERLENAGWPTAIWLSTVGYTLMAGALLAVAYVRLKSEAARDPT